MLEKIIDDTYKEYLKLNGSLEKYIYAYYCNAMYALYPPCDCPIDRNEAFDKFIKVVGSKREATKIFKSIDKIVAYT